MRLRIAALPLMIACLAPPGCATPPGISPAVDAQPAPGSAAAAVAMTPGPAAAEDAGPPDGPAPRRGDPAALALSGRVAAPAGFERIPLEPGGFGRWLREVPLLPAGSPVLLHTGEHKPHQGLHVAVLDFDVGARDLQQCADAVMRLRAEYLMSAGRGGEVCFRTVRGERLRWQGSGIRDFRKYLDRVFAFANSASLAREMDPVPDDAAVEPGDVFVQPARGGAFGHAVIAMDVAADGAGRRVFLLAQSYMPAQSIHVLVNRGAPALDPWYADVRDADLVTPEWVFAAGSLRRFRDGACARW